LGSSRKYAEFPRADRSRGDVPRRSTILPPDVAGIGPAPPPGVFRIDHDENFNETTHLQYQPWKRAPWFGFNWRYDSGLVAGAVPCFADTATCAFSTTTLGGAPAVAIVNNVSGLPLSPDQQFQAGLTCNGVHATPTTGLPPVCLHLSSVPLLYRFRHRVLRMTTTIHNGLPLETCLTPPGDDDLFHFHVTATSGACASPSINLTNKKHSNQLSFYFSGTHYVTRGPSPPSWAFISRHKVVFRRKRFSFSRTRSGARSPGTMTKTHESPRGICAKPPSGRKIRKAMNAGI